MRDSDLIVPDSMVPKGTIRFRCTLLEGGIQIEVTGQRDFSTVKKFVKEMQWNEEGPSIYDEIFQQVLQPLFGNLGGFNMAILYAATMAYTPVERTIFAYGSDTDGWAFGELRGGAFHYIDMKLNNFNGLWEEVVTVPMAASTAHRLNHISRNGETTNPNFTIPMLIGAYERGVTYV